jgi:hypothetical protein
MIDERDALIAEQDRIVAARDARLAEQAEVLAARAAALDEQVAYTRQLESMLHHPFLKIANRARKAVARVRGRRGGDHGPGA